MMKVILKLDLADDKTKQKAMKKVSGLSGLESISLDPKDKKLTVTGNIDPIDVVSKLRKICMTEIVSVGPEKKKDDGGPKKDDGPKKDGPKKEDAAAVLTKLGYQLPYYQNPYYYQNPQHHHHQPPVAAAVAPPSYPAYYQRSVEEDPNGCVIC